MTKDKLIIEMNLVFEMELVKFTDNGYPEYHLMEPGSSDGKVIGKFDATISVPDDVFNQVKKTHPKRDCKQLFT